MGIVCRAIIGALPFGVAMELSFNFTDWRGWLLFAAFFWGVGVALFAPVKRDVRADG